jgi:hypothetical protein
VGGEQSAENWDKTQQKNYEISFLGLVLCAMLFALCSFDGQQSKVQKIGE